MGSDRMKKLVVGGMFVWDGAFMSTQYDIGKDIYDDEKELMSETEYKLIRGGIQSASSHNMQPWKVKIHDQMTFSLYADMENEDAYLVIAKKESKALDFVHVGEIIAKLGLGVDGYTARPAV
jgi:hypothetical protein